MSALRPYAQLVRLPALPTALADIALGALATRSLPERWPGFILLLGSSACLYCGGMVFNDFFDVEQDRRERPDRPIPSGRVSRRRAGAFGTGLLAAGGVLALFAGLVQGSATLPAVLAGLLVATILLYDGWLKPTWAGPVVMGSCRFLNVLLGVSLAGDLAAPLGPHLATVVGLYIVGVTWLARTEARVSHPLALTGAACVLLAALLLALPVPAVAAFHESDKVSRSSPLFPYLLVVLGFALGFPVVEAIRAPSPARVQAAVRRCLLGLIALDAILACAVVGTVGLVLLVLLSPALYLSRRRWLYAT
jgi:4-hydroxybenzoate polyprenyltransferase